jgi:uncharacterized glyoxalase superfamily protein PhnB
MATQVKPIPTGYHTITPMLTVQEVDEAIDFYKRALGADQRARFIGPDGKSTMHAELKIGDSASRERLSEPADTWRHAGQPVPLRRGCG